MTLERRSLELLAEALDELDGSFSAMPAFEPEVDLEALRPVLREVARRMGDNFPYPHPLYAGQMLKPPHPVARLAYALSLWVNPNNHALDGGRASSAMEKEAVAALAAMFGWGAHLGHLCGGGTVANLEALWVAGLLHPGKTIVASSQAHYTHARVCGVLGLPFAAAPVDAAGRIDVQRLEAMLAAGQPAQGGSQAGAQIGTVVVTLGTTSLGAVDPLPEILALRDRYGFRVHADAAYGGYFRVAPGLGPAARAAFDALPAVDSIVVDPHKHGLQPYGCGCVLFKDPAVGAFYVHDSPYTYFSSSDLHLGEITLECSRPGAAAVALWATQRLLPLTPDGAFAAGLGASLRAAAALFARLEADPRFAPLTRPALDIVAWFPRPSACASASSPAGAQPPTSTQLSAISRRIYDEAARRHLHLALMQVPRALAEPALPGVVWDSPAATALRVCLLKPEHEAWLDRLHDALGQAADAVLGRGGAG
jgi:tyrosine decarboxylase / aspartate 1-decarboxylase